MNIATPPAALNGVSEAEWKVRVDLAALYRVVAHFRMTDLIYTHISISSSTSMAACSMRCGRRTW